MKSYRQAAEAGDAGAHYKLGLMYEYGEGVRGKRSPATTTECYQKKLPACFLIHKSANTLQTAQSQSDDVHPE